MLLTLFPIVTLARLPQSEKKKLDADIHEQTIENYLGQYII